MCDYCDCRSLAPIAALSADHEHLSAHSAAVRNALTRGDTASARAHFDELVAHLRPHTAAEEAGLFAQLRAEDSMLAPVDRLEGEHAQLWTAIDALDALDGASPRWAASVVEVLDDLAAHVWVEEYDIFPASVVGLSSDGWNRVIETVGARTNEEV